MLRDRAIGKAIGALVFALAIAMTGTANVAQASVPVKHVPICIDDFCFIVPVTDDYFVKVADFNSDGKPDLYVTGHPTRRFVSDFLLYQNAPDSYTIAPTPTPTQVTLAKAAPISPITVSRMELNADRYYDFYLRNVEEAIPNATDIVVTLTRGTGGTPSHVVPVNDEFQKTLAAFTHILTAADSWVSTSLQVICSGTSSVSTSLSDILWGHMLFPFRDYAPNPPPWSPYFPDLGLGDPTLTTTAGGFIVGYPNRPTQCEIAWELLNSPYKYLVIDTLAASKPGDIWSSQWCNDVWQRYGLTCPNRYIYQGGAVLAEFVVGTAIILAVLYYANEMSIDEVRDLVDAVTSAANEGWVGNLPIPPNATTANQADVGPGTSAVPATGVDKYAFQSNCNDMGPTNVPPDRGAAAPGSSGKLKKNMSGRGCGCPEGSEAHHILPKAPGDFTTRIRNCLHGAGLDIDHPENGVCLPKKKDPNSKAVVHGSANQKTYWADVAQRCEDAFDDNGTQGVRDFLTRARENLVNGKQWWKPGGGPF